MLGDSHAWGWKEWALQGRIERFKPFNLHPSAYRLLYTVRPAPAASLMFAIRLDLRIRRRIVRAGSKIVCTSSSRRVDASCSVCFDSPAGVSMRGLGSDYRLAASVFQQGVSRVAVFFSCSACAR